MLHENNGHLNGRTLVCQSDYPPAPPVEAPRPGWKDQFPTYTHNVSWNHDGLNHSMTLRSDSLTDLMRDLKLLKSLIRAGREQHAEAHTEPAAETPAAEPNTEWCPIHNRSMFRRNSRGGGIFYSHRLDSGEWCHGKERRASK